MNKLFTHKAMKHFVFIFSMLITAFLFAMTDAGVAQAGKKGVNECKLQSVTFEVGGKEYGRDGSLHNISVDFNTDFNELIKTIEITDYKVLVNDSCSHLDGHDSIDVYAEWWEWDEEKGGTRGYRKKFYTYDAISGEGTKLDIDKAINGTSCEIYFYLDGNPKDYISLALSKYCTVNYELNGGAFPQGMDVEERVSYDIELLSPMKEGSSFLGWKIKGKEDEDYIDYYFWDRVAESVTFVACWDDKTSPTNIEDIISRYTIELDCYDEKYYYKEEGVTPSCVIYDENYDFLYNGTDYYLTYKNNNSIASADSDCPPTVVINGIGKYCGSVEKTFSIVKGEYAPISEYMGYLDLDLAMGKPLSSIDMSDIRIMDDNYDIIEGTFTWEQEDYIPDIQEVNEYGIISTEYMSEEEAANYKLKFTPDNTGCYDIIYFTDNIHIHVKRSISDCDISFADGTSEYKYTGDEIKPKVIVKYNGSTLTEGQDYKVYYSGFVNVKGSNELYAPTVTVVGKI